MLTAEFIQFTAGEQMVFGAGSGLATDEWAEQHRIVVNASKHERWSFRTAPHTRFVLQLCDRPYIRRIFMCWSPQAAKTNIALTLMCKTVDDAPGAGMYILPTEGAAQRFSSRKMKQTFPAISRIAEKMSTAKKDNRDYATSFKNGAEWLVGWASSVSQISEISLRYLIWDEIDKYEDFKAEGNVIDYGDARLTDYPFTSLQLAFSSPKDLPSEIWERLLSADVIYRYKVKCPSCGEYHIMAFKNIKYPDADAGKIERERLAWYECPDCAAVWNDADRISAIRVGVWVGYVLVADLEGETDLSEIMSSEDAEYWSTEIPERPVNVGLHLPAWNIISVSLSKIAADFKRAYAEMKKGNVAKMKAFVQRAKAVPYIPEIKDIQLSVIKKLVDERPEGIVPSIPIVGITAGVDTQDNGFYYSIRAWAYGLSGTSFCVRKGFVMDRAALDKVLFGTQYEDVSGNKYVINISLVDSGGHQTSEVYDFCKMAPCAIATKGASQPIPQPYKFSNIEYYPGTKKPIPGGLQLMIINTQYYKDMLSAKLKISADDDGAFLHHAPNVTTPSDEDPMFASYVSQMTAEYIDKETGKWKCPKNKPNHYFDCEVANLVAYDFLALKYEQLPVAEEPEDERKTENHKSKKRSRW